MTLVLWGAAWPMNSGLAYVQQYKKQTVCFVRSDKGQKRAHPELQRLESGQKNTCWASSSSLVLGSDSRSTAVPTALICSRHFLDFPFVQINPNLFNFLLLTSQQKAWTRWMFSSLAQMDTQKCVHVCWATRGVKTYGAFQVLKITHIMSFRSLKASNWNSNWSLGVKLKIFYLIVSCEYIWGME